MALAALQKLRNKHFLALVGNAVISMFGLLQMWLLYRWLGKEDVGMWLVVMATLSILDSIRNGFLGTATIKFYAGAPRQRAADVLGSVWYLAILITLLMLAVNAGALPLMPFIKDQSTILTIQWVGITILSSLPFSVIFWKLQADEQYGTILWMRMINSGSTILSFVVLYFLGRFSLFNAFLWNALTNTLTSVVGMLAGLGGVKHITARTKATINELLHFGKYSCATSLTSTFMSTANTYMLNYMVGAGAVAILSVPTKLMELVEIPLRSFVGTGMSSMAAAQNQDNKQYFREIMNKYAGILTMAFIPLTIGVLLLADIPVNLLSSGKYAGTEAANIFRMVMIAALIYPIERFNGVALDLLHQPQTNFRKVLVMLAVKVAGNFIFIKALMSYRLAIYGAPISGFFTQLSGVIFGYFFLNKYMKFSIKDILVTGLEEVKGFAGKLKRRAA